MSTSAIPSFLFCLLLLFLHLPCATADPIYQQCGNSGNYTAKSTYESNLSLLLSNLTANGSRSGFATAVVGQDPDRIYGLVLCRGDTKASDCGSCLSTAAQDVLQLCPYKQGAGVWYDPCLLHYSNQDFLSTTYNPSLLLYNTQNITETDPELFTKFVDDQLMDKISGWAAYNTTKRFATGEVIFTLASPTIKGLVQCTPDLSETECLECLHVSMDQMENFTDGNQGAQVLGVRCNLRYELYSFFNGPPTLRLVSPVAELPAPAPPSNPAGAPATHTGAPPNPGGEGER